MAKSYTNFIPTIWSARLLENLRKNLVYASLVNTDYSGDIAAVGDSVKINQFGGVTIGTYDPATGLSDPEKITSYQQTLTVDQAKYFNFMVDDIEKRQANVNLIDGIMAEAAYGIVDVIDQYVAGLYTGVDTSMLVGDDTTPKSITTDAYDQLIALSVKLTDNKVPKVGRWVVIPAWFEGKLLLDDRFVKYSESANTRLENGAIGRAAGFDVYVSHNVPNTTGTKYKIIAGTNQAITYASQITETEAYRPDKFIADAVRGLYVYGAKLVKDRTDTGSKRLAVLTANIG